MIKKIFFLNTLLSIKRFFSFCNSISFIFFLSMMLVSCSNSDSSESVNEEPVNESPDNEEINLKILDPNYSNIAKSIEIDGIMYFSANDLAYGTEVRTFDGNSISLFEDITVGSSSTTIGDLINFNGNLVIFSDGMYVWDGTSLNFYDMNPSGSNYLAHPVIFNDELYFSCITATSGGTELCKFDGSIADMVVEICSINSSRPRYLTVYNNKIYFSARSTNYNYELWSYDGSIAIMEADIYPGIDYSSDPANLFVYNNKLYFSADDGTNGIELWVHDGSTTTLVADIASGSNSSEPSNFIIYNNKLYFSAFKENTGRELFSYDGSSVTNVSDVMEGSLSSNPEDLIIYNNKLYFTAFHLNYGREIFSFDGLNVKLEFDIIPGISSSTPSSFFIYNEKLFFNATTLIDDISTNGITLYIE